MFVIVWGGGGLTGLATHRCSPDGWLYCTDCLHTVADMKHNKQIKYCYVTGLFYRFYIFNSNIYIYLL